MGNVTLIARYRSMVVAVKGSTARCAPAAATGEPDIDMERMCAARAGPPLGLAVAIACFVDTWWCGKPWEVQRQVCIEEPTDTDVSEHIANAHGWVMSHTSLAESDGTGSLDLLLARLVKVCLELGDAVLSVERPAN
jgi:hypothetical protein